MRRGTRNQMIGSVAIAIASWSTLAGCDGDLATEFRVAAGGNFQQGVMSILTGVVDGTFALIEPDSGSDSTN
ncbi:MAG: hypothetical protein IID43_05850 [Planctomycetes bacterium]|nr:hypothetical protein [Planctomycetota bacterium]